MRRLVVACAGGIVFDRTHRLLVILRAHPPDANQWSVPGGRCEPGESSSAACVRELAEETGLHVRVLRLAGSVSFAAEEVTYDIDDYVCALLGGTLTPGDDAGEARWVTRAELAGLPLVAGLWDALSSWDCLPA